MVSKSDLELEGRAKAWTGAGASAGDSGAEDIGAEDIGGDIDGDLGTNLLFASVVWFMG